MLRHTALLLLAAALVACGRDSAPAGEDAAESRIASPAEFVSGDSIRILEELAWLSADGRAGRRAGSPEGAQARDYIVQSLERDGVPQADSTRLQEFPLRTRSDTTGALTGVNILAAIPGRERTDEYIVLTAHYDHVGVREDQIFNGADDNASGTVAVMAMARYLNRNPLRHSVLVGIVDAEEMGLQGARAFLEQPPVPLRSMVLNVNLDMVSRSDSLLFVSGTHHHPRLRPILEAVEPSPPVVLRLGHDRPDLDGEDDWTFSSDHGAFHERGIPFLYFGVEDHEDYHRPTDDFERVDPGFYLASIRTILDALIRLDSELGSLPAGGEEPGRSGT